MVIIFTQVVITVDFLKMYQNHLLHFHLYHQIKNLNLILVVVIDFIRFIEVITGYH